MQKSAINPAVHLPINAAFEHLFFAAMGPCAPTMLNFTMKEGLINTEVVLQCGDCLDKGHGCADNQNRENHELCSDEGAHDECSGGVADQCSYRAVVLCSHGDLHTFAREHIMTQNLAIDQGRRHFLQHSLESGSSGPVAGIWHFSEVPTTQQRSCRLMRLWGLLFNVTSGPVINAGAADVVDVGVEPLI